MRDSINSEDRPSIIVSAADERRLTDVAITALEQVPEVAEELLLEIERAEVVPTHAVPANVVQMGSTVEFTTEEGLSRRVTLVFPGQADVTAAKISDPYADRRCAHRTLRGPVNRVDDAGWPKASPYGVGRCAGGTVQ